LETKDMQAKWTHDVVGMLTAPEIGGLRAWRVHFRAKMVYNWHMRL
jgi:hypothetical protein